MIYEMRVYRCLPGRLPALLKRFETVTLKLWEKHGIKQAGFFTTVVGESNQDLTYLLAWDSFNTIRTYLVDHVQWMVSDATGVPPKFGEPAGFEYETYGAFQRAHIDGGKQIAANWRAEFAAQPKRKLGFRFGYYDGSPSHSSHLAIMRRVR